jgi:AcrR family transcriptional regulator
MMAMRRATAPASEPEADPQPLGLRERKKERVREQLIEAAVKLFSRKGLDATTIDDIVAAVEVSRRTFFRYFDTKEDVLPAWFDRHVDGLLAQVDARPAGEDAMRTLRHVLDGMAEIYAQKLAVVMTIQRVMSREPSIVARRAVRLELLAERLAERLAARSSKPEADMVLLSRLTMAMATSAVERWASAGGKGDLAAVMGECFEVVQQAFAAYAKAPSRRR